MMQRCVRNRKAMMVMVVAATGGQVTGEHQGLRGNV